MEKNRGLKDLLIKVTNECNANCKFCYIKKNNNQEIPFDNIKNLFAQFSNLGGKKVLISGGEPLLRRDICKIIEELNKLKIYSCLATNGILINNETFINLKNAGLNKLHFSVGDMEDIEVLNMIKKKIGMIKNHKENVKIGVNVITSCDFVKKCDDNLEWLEKLDIDFIEGIPPKCSENEKWFMDKKMSIQDNYKLIKSLSGISTKFDYNCGYFISQMINRNKFNSLIIKKECNIQKFNNFLTIASDGKVYPCPYATEENYCIGDIKMDALEECIKRIKEINISNLNKDYSANDFPCMSSFSK